MKEEEEFVSDLIEQGVPTAEVMEDVEAYLKKEGNISIEEGIRRLEAIYRKYKQVEQQLTEQKLRLVSKLPDLKKSIEVVNHLEEKSKINEAMELTHLLNDHVYQRVKTDSLDKVLLWLGSNVMVEFSLDEARCILEDNYKTEDGVTKYEKELAFLKDQITTTEVNMAHVYNYGIRQKAGR
ncbi:prefoldin subunit [Onchocerca flexuosa]|uniref:Prefoldin subunit 3 n=2 Tax=Onchocerca flexuosa TaxID=387005 RepID=A0A238BWH9_9BILA|nr:prefoldin subunit [Onchocerca flexuosa]